MSNFASVKTVSGLAGLRDLTSSDLPSIALRGQRNYFEDIAASGRASE
jgi:hypothetical protein